MTVLDVDEAVATVLIDDSETYRTTASLAGPGELTLTDVTADWSCRIRVYSDAGVWADDESRQPWEDPVSWTGILLDIGLGLTDNDIPSNLDEGWEAALTPDATGTVTEQLYVTLTNYIGQAERIHVHLIGEIDLSLTSNALYPNPDMDFPVTFDTWAGNGPQEPAINRWHRVVADADPVEPGTWRERSVLLDYAFNNAGALERAFSPTEDWAY